MIKYSISVVFQLFIAYAGIGQSGTYNMTKLLPYPKTEFNQMILHKDTIVVYGVGFNNNIEWKQGVAIAKLDTSGNVVENNFILDTLGDLLATDKAWGNIIRTADGGYAAVAATVGRKSAFLIKMSNNLQVEFIKEYPDTVNLSNYFYKLLETPEGYLLYGAIQRPDYDDDGFIRYVDKQGNTIWFKYFEYSPYWTVAQDIKRVNDSVYVCAFLSWNYPNISKPKYFPSFLYFNIQGNEVDYWESPSENPEMGAVLTILHVDENSMILYGVHVPDQVGSTLLVQSTLTRLNNNFTTEWVKHFGLIRSSAAFVILHDFAPTTDGHYIGAGETTVKDGTDPTRRVGWLYKFSTEGDSIWERKINAPFLPLYYTNSGFFAGVGVLSSGNIIAGGTTNEGNTDYCWLVKVSNDGCLDTLYCQPVSTTASPTAASAGVTLSPNPAHDVLRIEYPGSNLGGYVRLFDMQGRLHRELPLPTSGNQVEIYVNDIPNGPYVAQWLCNGQTGYAKVIISH